MTDAWAWLAIAGLGTLHGLSPANGLDVRRRGASRCTPIRAQAGYAVIALWSFLMATAHGAGLMLLPALP